MTGFSKYLQAFVKKRKISMVDISKETGIDRTIVYRYIKGSRVPSNAGIVIKIANAMGMSDSEKKYLLEEYDKLLLGEPLVSSYQHVNKLIGALSERLHSFTSQLDKTQDLKMNSPVMELNSKGEIVAYILELFRFIAEKKNSSNKVCFIMQPFYREIQNLTLQLFNHSNIRIEQIVCLEQNISRGYENLRVLQEVLPLCYVLSKYEIYYYYDLMDSHINAMSFMPNLIIAGNQVIQFDYKMDYGVVIKDSTYVKAIYKQYELLRRETRSLLRGGSVLKILPKFAKNKDLDIFYGAKKMVSRQLCISACLDREMLTNHIYSVSGKEEFIKALLRRYGDWNGETSLNFGKRSMVISYGTLKGMEEFMETGKIVEFPESLYSPLMPEERRIVLQRMIILMKQGCMSYRFMANDIDFPREVQLSCFNHQKIVVVNRVMESKILQVMVDELSIYRTFSLYLEYLEKKNLYYSESETLHCLENMLIDVMISEEKVNC